MRILLIEDSPRLSKYVAAGLRREGYAVDASLDGEEGQYLAESGEYDAIVLDLMLPKRDGLTVLRALRSAGIKTHVLILTARDSVEDRVRGLCEGGDDYLVKPFAFEELVARLQALIRRGYGVKTNVLRFGQLEIDMGNRTVTRSDAPLPLKPREYALLEYLALRAGGVVTRAEIEQRIYDERVAPMSNVVDSAICTLRRAIDPVAGPSYIQTRRGVGYVFGESPE